MALSSGFAALLCLALLCGCGVEGPPQPTLQLPAVDMHTDLGKVDGSAVLAAPRGWTPAPTEVTPVFATPAPQLFAAMQELLAAEPRTWVMNAHPDIFQASFIVRSVLLNLPDVIVVQAVAASPATSRAVIFSRSRYDKLPYLSVNKTRVDKLVEALKQKFGTAPDPEPPKPAVAVSQTVTPPAATIPPGRTTRPGRS